MWELPWGTINVPIFDTPAQPLALLMLMLLLLLLLLVVVVVLLF